jgi:hypothetical protein
MRRLIVAGVLCSFLWMITGCGGGGTTQPAPQTLPKTRLPSSNPEENPKKKR